MESAYRLELRLPFGESFITVRMGQAAFQQPDCWDAGSHSNTDYEVHILLAGGCVVEAGNRRLTLGTGEGLLVRRGVFHHPCSTEEGFFRFSVNLMPESPALEQALFERLGQFSVFSLTEEEQRLCRCILQVLAAREAFYLETLQGCLLQLLAGMFRKLCPEAERSGGPTENMLQQRIVIIDQFFACWLRPCGTEEALAQQLNLSRRQLGRLLHQYYGMSFREKLRQSRMEYAGSLLRTTDKTVSEICTAVGYREEAAFFKAFRSYYHMTPGRYRKSAGADRIQEVIQ